MSFEEYDIGDRVTFSEKGQLIDGVITEITYVEVPYYYTQSKKTLQTKDMITLMRIRS